MLVLRPSAAAPPAAADAPVSEAPPPGIPLVLRLADPASATVLSAGARVDLYAAYGEEPPTLSVSGVRLLEVLNSESGITSTTSHNGNGAYIVVHITISHLGLVENLLAATSIVATVSAVASD